MLNWCLCSCCCFSRCQSLRSLRSSAAKDDGVRCFCFNYKKSNNAASILITILRLVQAQHQHRGRDFFTHWLMFYQLIINCFTYLSAAGQASPYSAAKASFTQASWGQHHDNPWKTCGFHNWFLTPASFFGCCYVAVGVSSLLGRRQFVCKHFTTVEMNFAFQS